MYSFSYKVKEEIIGNVSNSKQARFMLIGMLCACREADLNRIVLNTENELVKDFFVRNVQAVTGFECVEVQNSGSRLFTLTVNSSGAKTLVQKLKLSVPPRLDENVLPSAKYSGAILSGAFLAAGSVNSPDKKYHMQIALPSLDLCNDFGLFIIDRFAIIPKHSNRRQSEVIYLKESENIEDLLVIMGATNAAFEIMNAKIEKDIHNKVNRVMNCDNANIDKSVKASNRQIENIEFLAQTVGLESLSPPLQEIARVRIENPEFNLKELGEAMKPPISRSGANHRLERIALIADEERAKRKETK